MDESEHLTTPQRHQQNKPVFACIRCSDRKVKCNRQSPCDTCTKHGVECVFRPPRVGRKRRTLVKDNAKDERLNQYEALLRQHGIDPNGALAAGSSQESDALQRSEVSDRGLATATASPKSKVTQDSVAEIEQRAPLPPDREPQDEQKTFFKPQVIKGASGTKFVDNSMWSRMAEELHSDEETSDIEDSAEDTDDSGGAQNDFTHVLGSKGRRTEHPPPHIIFPLWRTFVENVDPMLKMVHVPTLTLAIEKAARDLSTISRGFEALMFAIYAAAVFSLTKEKCLTMTGDTRQALVSRYVSATKAALARASFMSSTSLVVLQALTIHILVIRNTEEPRAVWTLTGVAIRVAEGMGMRVDGALLGLSPFETEIRRRIWWQIKMHDFRAAELSGQKKFEGFEINETSPKRPGNINDTSLYPSMTEPAVESDRPTEMTWCVFRSDLTTFAVTQKAKLRQQSKSMLTSEEFPALDDLKLKDDFVAQQQDFIETKYIRYCDPSQPLQLLLMVAARTTFNLMRFISHHPRRWTNPEQVPESEKQMIWTTVLQLLEQYHMMQSNELLKGFSWCAPYFFNWSVIIHVLDTLQAQPLHQDAFKAWRLINFIYEENTEMLLDTKKVVFVVVGNLCLRAYHARELAIKQRNVGVPDPPRYIIQLRGQREAARARKMAANARRKASGVSGLNPEGQTLYAGETTRSEDVLRESQGPRENTAFQTSPSSGDSSMGEAAFWLKDDATTAASAAGQPEPMSLDLDSMLVQDLWQTDTQQQPLDWNQWDAWLLGGSELRAFEK